MCCLTYLFLYAVLYCSCYCSFIEFSDLSDNLSSIWGNKYNQGVQFVTSSLSSSSSSTLSSSQQTKCTVQASDGTAEGTCKTRTQCLLSGGVPRGRCGLLSTCCTYSRIRTTNAKVSYFSSADVQLTESPISFHVVRMNANVCQLRLDFVEFDLAPVNQTQTGIASQTNYQCSMDNFYVIPGPYVPQICGANTGQHIYVSMPNELNNITLNVKFTPRTTDLPKWNIKVTQLQCPRITDKAVTIDNGVAEDFLSIAPQGCLQYFTKESGNIRNFGYVDSANNQAYASDQFYSICFRRTDYYCGINYSVREARLNSESSACRDYLMVPGLVIGNGVRENNKLCTNLQFTSNINVQSRAPGPFHINFYSGTNNAVGGFNMDYTLEPCTYS